VEELPRKAGGWTPNQRKGGDLKRGEGKRPAVQKGTKKVNSGKKRRIEKGDRNINLFLGRKANLEGKNTKEVKTLRRGGGIRRKMQGDKHDGRSERRKGYSENKGTLVKQG